MTDQTKRQDVRHPEFGTPALLEYLWASSCDARLFHFVVDTALKTDYVVHVARQALDGKSDYKDKSPTDLAREQPGRHVRTLRELNQELLEMFVVRAIDNFQVYLVEAIRLALHKQPRILADRKQELSLGHILKFDSIESLTRDIVEGKLQALSYEGFGELETWCTTRSIPLLVPEGKRPQIVELIALRNIIVHNRGRVDDRYAAAVPSCKSKTGERRLLSVDDLFGGINLLNQVAVMTDSALAGKFGLEILAIREQMKDRWSARHGDEDSSSPGEESSTTL